MDLIHPDRLACWDGPWIGPTPWQSFSHRLNEEVDMVQLLEEFQRLYPKERLAEIHANLQLGESEKKKIAAAEAKVHYDELTGLGKEIWLDYFHYPSQGFSFRKKWDVDLNHPPTLALEEIEQARKLELFDDLILLAHKNRRAVFGQIESRCFPIVRWGKDVLEQPNFTQLFRQVLHEKTENRSGETGYPYPVWNYLWALAMEKKRILASEITLAVSISPFWNNRHCEIDRYKISFKDKHDEFLKPIYICPKCGVYTGGPKDFQPKVSGLLAKPIALSAYKDYQRDLEQRKKPSANNGNRGKLGG